MTAYEIIQQHPEWVKNPTATRKEIEATARRYVRELDNGSKHFCDLITDDFDALLIARNAMLNPVDEAKDFAKIAIIGNEIIDDGAKRMAKVCTLFIKAIIVELNGKAICTAAQIQEWRERYGVKLEGLRSKPEQITKVVRELKPIADIKAEKIYMSLKNWEYIDCGEDIFLWHFGERKHRKEMQAPAIVEWKKNLQYVFAYCCNRISNITEPGNDTNWKALEQHIKPNPNMRWDWKKANGRLKDAKKVLKTNKELLRLENLFDEVKKMDEEKANPELKNETADTYNNFLKSLEQELKFKK